MLDERPPRIRFAELVARPDAQIELAKGALLAATALEYPGLDATRYEARLDALGTELCARLGRSAGAAELVATLNHLLFAEEGFQGNEAAYQDPRNSYLNEVLDRRLGIPITLSLVYLEVARRAGHPLEGVGLPGHFLVRAPAPDGGLLVDPFHGGLVLAEEDCQRRLDGVYGGRLQLEPPMLAATGNRALLARLLRNLKLAHMRARDWQRGLRVIDLLFLLDPFSGEDLRDRGLLYAAMDCYGLAARDLEAYLERRPQAPEAPPLRAKLSELHRRAALVN